MRPKPMRPPITSGPWQDSRKLRPYRKTRLNYQDQEDLLIATNNSTFLLHIDNG